MPLPISEPLRVSSPAALLGVLWPRGICGVKIRNEQVNISFIPEAPYLGLKRIAIEI